MWPYNWMSLYTYKPILQAFVPWWLTLLAATIQNLGFQRLTEETLFRVNSGFSAEAGALTAAPSATPSRERMAKQAGTSVWWCRYKDRSAAECVPNGNSCCVLWFWRHDSQTIYLFHLRRSGGMTVVHWKRSPISVVMSAVTSEWVLHVRPTVGYLCLQSARRAHSTHSTDSVGGQLRGDKECPFSGVTKPGRIWRKVPESDVRSVSRPVIITEQ